MSLFYFADYKEFMRNWIVSQPKKGRGCIKEIAAKLKINPALLSQILNSKRNLTLEQAHGLTEIFGLNELEREYFITLVEISKNQSPELQSHFQGRLERIKNLRASENQESLYIKKVMAEPALTFQYAIRHEDIPKIKKLIANNMSQINEIVAESNKPDSVLVFNLDLFRIY
jgi:transcriptional regulator with XRE-family HTH domain